MENQFIVLLGSVGKILTAVSDNDRMLLTVRWSDGRETQVVRSKEVVARCLVSNESAAQFAAGRQAAVSEAFDAHSNLSLRRLMTEACLGSLDSNSANYFTNLGRVEGFAQFCEQQLRLVG